MSMQMSLIASARQRGHELAGLAAERAEREHDGLADAAVERLRQWVVKQREPFTIEHARAAIAAELPAPPDLRAWGSVTLLAKRRLYIVQVPRLFMPAASSHGSPKAAYARGSGA
jgi:hypothetical protein